MAAQNLTLKLDGTISISPSGTMPSNAGSSRVMPLGLNATTMAAAEVIVGAASYEVSNVTNEDLPLPTTFSARFLALRLFGSNSSLAVRVTHAGGGQVTYRTSGLLVLEVNDTEKITAIDVTGSAEFEWLAIGRNAV